MDERVYCIKEQRRERRMDGVMREMEGGEKGMEKREERLCCNNVKEGWSDYCLTANDERASIQRERIERRIE